MVRYRHNGNKLSFMINCCSLCFLHRHNVFLCAINLLSNQNKDKHPIKEMWTIQLSTSWVLGLTLSNRRTRRPRIVNICSLFCY